MLSFKVEDVINPDDNPFDRQQRIDWWSQDKIAASKIMVVGAGATGNETLKNLALLGFKNIFIVDLDVISLSNLSRTVLFRKEDMGKKKAEVAAQRIREMCLANEARIDWFDGDIVWELGTGLYRYMDVVLGCLDNVETRFEVNKQCWLAETPWIDSGINELGIHVATYIPPNPPCYECALSNEQRIARRKRYSCDDFKRAMLGEEKVPTVQVASALASAMQTQEAMKLICGQPMMPGKKIYYQGTIHDFEIIQLPINEDCPAHATYPDIIDLPIKTDILLRDFLGTISTCRCSGDGAILDFNAYRTFVVSAPCRSCGKQIDFHRPSFKIFDAELICDTCNSEGPRSDEAQFVSGNTEKITLSEFGLNISDDRVLGLTLHELGVPYWPVLAVRNTFGEYKYYELSGDKELLLPNMSLKGC